MKKLVSSSSFVSTCVRHHLICILTLFQTPCTQQGSRARGQEAAAQDQPAQARSATLRYLHLLVSPAQSLPSDGETAVDV